MQLIGEFQSIIMGEYIKILYTPLQVLFSRVSRSQSGDLCPGAAILQFQLPAGAGCLVPHGVCSV